MTGLESRPHSVHIAYAFEREVQPSVSHVDEHLLNRSVVVLRVNEFIAAELLGHFELVGVDIDANYPLSAFHLAAVSHSQSDGAQPPYGASASRFDVSRVERRTETCRYLKAKQLVL